MIKLSEEQIVSLKEIVEHFDNEDASVRERQVRVARRLKLFWEGFQNVWYDSVAHDWRIYEQQTEDDDTNQEYYDKRVNVFRAYLESIIAALSIIVPPVKCFPDDADNSLDLSTARAGDKVAQLIARHNDHNLLWLHALFIFCTEGMIAFYNCPQSDESYGTYKSEKTEEVEEQVKISTCPHCGYTEEEQLAPDEIKSDEEISPETEVSDENNDVMNEPSLSSTGELEGNDMCAGCGVMMQPNVTTDSRTTTRTVEIKFLPKTRVKMDAFGTLYVKIPVYARKQEDCQYLIWSYETHYVNAIERYKHIRDTELINKIRNAKGSPVDTYASWARLNPQYQGSYPIENVTIRNAWLRPAAFEIINNDDKREELLKLFPNGCKVVLVNDEFAEACDEQLDDYWTLSHNPLADYLLHDPLGLLLTSIQDITNDLISLTLQTIEHGIGLTYADPNVLNFKAFAQTQVTPGGVFPATPKSGKSLADAFHNEKTTSLSAEVLPFAQKIQEYGQLVSGALPSLFGGSIEGSETASQYSMSRAQAQQRLQNTWKMLTTAWKINYGKAIPMYIKNVKEDERDVHRTKDGGFINVFIRRAELEGKIGKVELEANENLPLTWAQQKDIVMTLLQSGNPEILQIIGAPENLHVIRDAIGLTDFFVPGQDDIDKQYDEIRLLTDSEPIVQPTDPMMMAEAQMNGMAPPPEQELPSVEIEPDIDNNQIHFEICRKWLVSEAGRIAKIDNANGYRNVLLHAKMHLMAMQPPPMTPDTSGANSEGESNKQSNRDAPITGEENVSVTH